MSGFIDSKGLLNRLVALTSFLFVVPFLSAQEFSAPVNNQQNNTPIIAIKSPESIKFAVDDNFSLSGEFYLGGAVYYCFMTALTVVKAILCWENY
jgi:hypothetical protein